MSSSNKVLSVSNLNENIVRMEYAVRGPIPMRAVELMKQLKSDGTALPFEEVIRANIGDCHMMGEHPITFIRQVLSASLCPESAQSNASLPEDVKERVKLLLSYCGGGSVGAYSDSAGIEIVRRHIAEYITDRDDGVECDWRNVILTSGASEAVKCFFALINSSSSDGLPTGVMVPIPQYPLYSATIAELGMHLISYYLDEDNQWALDVSELERALKQAEAKCKPKAIVVINPGNPTGSVLTRQNIGEIVRFAKKNNLLIIADEVYQHNIWAEGAQFHSFRKIMNVDVGEQCELVSLMSASKGYMGECGLRGGYMEMVNFDPQVQAVFFKQLSARLCSSLIGQLAMDCIVRPPRPSDPSYEQYARERAQVLASLKGRAELSTRTLNSLPGIRCNPVAGAMYAFPRLDLPDKLVQAARAANQQPDFFYASNLLEQTGICVVPGCGFGQIPGTYHFRTTILPQPDLFKRMMDKLRDFHLKFLEQYK